MAMDGSKGGDSPASQLALPLLDEHMGTKEQPLSRQAANVLLLSLLWTLFMCVMSGNLTVTEIVASQWEQEGLDTLPIAAVMCGEWLACVPAAFIFKRVGRSYGFALSSIFGIAAGLCGYLAVRLSSFYLLLTSGFLLGVWGAHCGYLRYTAAEVVAERFKNRAVSMVLCGSLLSVAGPQLATFAVSLGGYKYFYLLVAVVCCIYLVLSLLLSPPPEAAASNSETQAAQQQQERPLWEIARSHVCVTALLGGGSCYFAMVTVMTSTPLAMNQHYGLPLEQVAYTLQAHLVGMFLPSFFTGNIIDHLGVLKVLLMGCVALFGSAAIASTCGYSFTMFVTALPLLGLGWNLTFVSATLLLERAHSKVETTKVQALNEFIVQGANVLGSSGAAVLLQCCGWTVLNIVAIAPVVLTTLAACSLLLRTERQTEMLPA